jgi:hypothetical protein
MNIFLNFQEVFFTVYVPMRFFEATPGRAHALKNFFFAGFPFFTSK